MVTKSSKEKGMETDSLTGKVRITLIDYNKAEFQEKEVKTIEECFPFKDKPTVTWINIDGLNQLDILQKISDCFGFHPLVLKTIQNTDQRPKLEDYGDYIFVVLKMLSYDEAKARIRTEQVSLILSSKLVISFQEKPGDVFEPVRERIRTPGERIRKEGADYLVYSLMEAIINNYFIIEEKLGEKIEFLEEGVVKSPTPQILQIIHDLKREMMYLRKSVWPLREVISDLERGESPLIKEPNRVYFRDIYEHTIGLIDTIETSRDMISGMLDIYLSSISNRMNEIMKVLTIIATIFMPLTFIAGVYGMNFRYMPELRSSWGYPLTMLGMVIIVILMLLYFRKRKWI